MGPRDHRTGRRHRLTAIVACLALAVSVAPAAVTASTGPLFEPYQAIPVPSSPEAVAIGDVTGDGRSDVVLTTSYDFDAVNDFRLWVFAQTGSGSLSAPVSYATAASYTDRATSAVIGDITGDGLADVVLGIEGQGVQVFPQLPSGSLGSPTMTATADSLRIRLGRLDGDALLDVAGVGWGTNTVSVLLNDGAGGLGAATAYPAQHGGYDDLEVADVTGDGLDDLVVMSGQLYAVPNISVVAQLPAGGFGPPAEYRVGTNVNTQGIGVGDVDGDGLNDVVAAYGGNRPNASIAVFPQQASGVLGAPVRYASYDIPEPVEVEDLDGDGRDDVVTLHGGWNRAGVYRQLSTGALGTEELYAIPYASHYNPHGLAVGDVNDDGLPDVVAADYNNGLVVLRQPPPPPPPTVPGAPTLISATPGDGSVSLAWDAPASDGGSPITSYTATASPDGATCTSADTGCTVDGLSNGTTYTFTVRATNAIGQGPASNTLTAMPGTAPSAPRNVTAKSSGPGGVQLKWSSPATTGGSAVTGYRIHRSTTSGGETFLVAVPANTTSFADRTTTRGVRYFYWITAMNGIGEGPPSAEVSAVAR